MAVSEETPQSLRLYFGLVAGFSLFFGSVALAQAQGSAIVIGLAAANIALGLLFGYIVYAFPRLLARQPRFLKGVLIANFALSAVIFLLSAINGALLHALFRVIIAVVVFVYLMKSVSRLSQAAGPTPQ